MLPDKGALRIQMKAVRAAVEGRAEKDARICARLLSVRQVAESESCFLYRSFGQEASTRGIAAELARRGKRIYYPRVCGREMLLVRDAGQGFAAGAYGIEEPLGAAEQIVPDVAVLPLLAADRQLRRLGYGGGFYDRFLAQAPHIFKIGICYHAQLLEEIPAEAHDVPLDALVTERELLLRAPIIAEGS